MALRIHARSRNAEIAAPGSTGRGLGAVHDDLLEDVDDGWVRLRSGGSGALGQGLVGRLGVDCLTARNRRTALVEDPRARRRAARRARPVLRLTLLSRSGVWLGALRWSGG